MNMKNVNIQAPIGVPIVGSLVAFILVTLALFSGKQPGFMEDYSIVAFNTSELGKQLVPSAASSTQTSQPSSCIPGVNLGPLDKGCSAVASAVASAESSVLDSLRDIENDIADKLSEKLGIKEFYSLHAMTLCEGNFSPNTTASDAVRNVTFCTPALQTAQYNVTAIFDHELKVGPMKLSLTQLGFTQDLQKAFDALADLLKALGVIYIVAMGSTGLSTLGSVSALFLIPRHALPVFRANSVLAGLSALALIVGSMVVTIGAHKGVKEVNEHGDAVGLVSEVGYKFIAISWSATGLMIITLAYWLVCWFKNKRQGNGAFTGRGSGGLAFRKSTSSSPPMQHVESMSGARPANLPRFDGMRTGSHHV